MSSQYTPVAEVERIKPPKGWKPELLFAEGHRSAGQSRCTSWNYRKGAQCLNHPCRKQNVCHKHGAQKTVGLAHHNYKGRGFSPHVPKMNEALDRYLEDPSLRNLDAEIDFYTHRQMEAIKALYSSGGLPDYDALFEAQQAFVAGQQQSDTKAMASAFALMTTLIVQGKENTQHLKQWESVTQQKMNAVKIQWAHFDKEKDYILIRDMAKMLFAFCENVVFVLRKHNVDRAVSTEIVEVGERTFGFAKTLP